MKNQESSLKPWQLKLHEVIYEADTPAGKFFDVSLIVFILLSVGVVMLDSVRSISESIGPTLHFLEWFFTIAFSIEYILRLICIKKKLGYFLSFFGIIDLLAILPTYLEFILQSHDARLSVGSLAVIRVLRVLRLFRILKLTPYLAEANVLTMALKASSRKVFVFLSSVVVLVILLGALMYLIESRSNDVFSSIPESIYWAIVTITTVGYGDIAPITSLGKFLASIAMIMGYAIIAVPTGIVSVEINAAMKKSQESNNTQSCTSCSGEGHDNDAQHCKYCGDKLN
jgi:voltage-gated potassium channel